MISKTALIVGASRGIGLGLVQEYLSRGWNVIATVRGAESAKALQELTGELQIEYLDINNQPQIAELAERLNGISLDLLFVNAGVCDDPTQSINEVSTEEFTHVFVTNALSPLRVIEALAHLVTKDGTVAAMSSALGSVSSNTEGSFELYRASKAALNMLLRSYAVRAGVQRSLLAIMPGWVRTAMGGPDAPVEVEDSVKGIADTIAAHSGKPGLVFVDYQNQMIPW